MIPLNPVDTTAPTNEINLKHFSSLIISDKISKPSERFTASNPPDFESSLKISSIDVCELISTSFTGRPGAIIV